MNEQAIKQYGPLAAARKSALVTQKNMAEKLGCSVTTLVEMEKHPDKIDLGTLGRFYQHVGADGKAILERYVNGFFIS